MLAGASEITLRLRLATIVPHERVGHLTSEFHFNESEAFFASSSIGNTFRLIFRQFAVKNMFIVFDPAFLLR